MTETWKRFEGQVVDGEFHLCQYLGGDDHSAVFLTRQDERERQKSAIKLVPADPQNAELQLSRWRLAAKLSHPHLMQLSAMGRCGLGTTGLLYIVMEYAQEDLSEILPQRSLESAEVRDMLEPVLDALAYLHGRGFVHGHIKPANIMAIDDRLKLSSDGLCRIGESTRGLGKPSPYDPPESASGEITPAGDVWSLGMTLVEALTQRLPVWERLGEGEPSLPEALPEPFVDLARHCLRRDPQKRWTVADIAARLHQTLSVPQEKTSPTPKEAFAKWRYVVPIVVGLALAAMLAGPKLINRRPEAQRAPSIAREKSSVQPKSEQKSATPKRNEPAPRTSDAEKSSYVAASAPAPVRSDGDSKTPTPGLVRGEVLDQVLPDVPQKAKDTIQGKVRVSVRVHVDPSGSVVEAEFDSPGSSTYFADLAIKAARLWEFVPAEVDGHNVSSEWVLRFEFAKTTTKVFPVQVAP